jgi:uncharacterized membrane protein
MAALEFTLLAPASPVLAFGPLVLEFMNGWQAALLFGALAVPIVQLGRNSLNGLGPVRKWVAIGVRLAVLLLLVLIIAGVRWQRRHEDLEVMVLRDVSRSTTLVTDYPGTTLQDSINDYLRSAMKQPDKHPNDRLGIISFKEKALVDAMPDKELRLDTRAVPEPPRGTDPSAAIQLALATLSPDAMHRMLLIWDGNQTEGDLDTAVAAAAAQHIPIDVMPLHYDVRNATMVDKFVAPPLRRENEPFTIDVVLRSTSDVPVTGKLTVRHRREGGEDLLVDAQPITLAPNGPTVEHVRVPALKSPGVHQFHATFVPDQPTTAPISVEAGAAPAHQLPEINKEADAFTLVMGKGQVLYVDNFLSETGERGPGEVLAKALAREGITARTVGIEQVPSNVVDLQNYDAILLGNVPRGALSSDQDKMLASYVHDMGGGLVMIGGDQSFGAGGWQGSQLEKVLPVDMDVPAQRQVGKGALVLIMHSCEMPNGNYWGEQCAIKAAEALSQHDEIGVISYDWGGGGSRWDFPLAEKGDGSRVTAAIKTMKLGDMPSFDDSMNVALNGGGGSTGLKASNAQQKHVIIISDGDPAAPNNGLIAQYIAAKVSVSTVTVYPHFGGTNSPRPPVMDDIAGMLKGRAYGPIDSNPNQLPQIFIKEAVVVRRNLIYEDENGIPIRLIDASDDLVKGIGDFPPVRGMVLTTKKNDPKVEMPLSAGKLSDPILAHWQTGLGKAAAFTSDAYNKWAVNWVGSTEYDKLWAQIVRGVSRAPISADFEVHTNLDGPRGKIVVEAYDKDASARNFLSMTGTVVGGVDMKERPVRLVQTGPGTYEAEFDTNGPGNYVVALHYSGQKGENGMLISGVAMNNDPEMRDLQSNEAKLDEIAQRTGGRVLDAWDAANANLFSRAGVAQTASPMPIWDQLIPFLLLLILIDVAVRRIAWDWAAIKRTTADRIRSFTTLRRVESRHTLDALRQVREETTKPAVPVKPLAAPDASAKFEAKGVEGDISSVVGGATDKPIPSAPKKVEPKGGGPGEYTNSLLEAKRRAKEQIRKKEKGEE